VPQQGRLARSIKGAIWEVRGVDWREWQGELPRRYTNVAVLRLVSGQGKNLCARYSFIFETPPKLKSLRSFKAPILIHLAPQGTFP
jgi:hypothetical protein